MKKLKNEDEYKSFLVQVKERIASAQYEALKQVNKELIGLYWDIGKMIIERQKKHNWGKSIVINLSTDLQKDFPGIIGFSAQNLWYMRQLFLEYHGNKKLQPLVGEISWTKNIVIMSKCKDALKREFYIRMTRKMGWTKNVLIHQIENKTYEKTLLNQTNFDKALPEKICNQAKLAVKDEYLFDFLELSDQHSERELEKAILSNMDSFLREMGGNMAFIGSQFRLEIKSKEYFIDILLFHRHLRCLIAIDLKIGEFIPEYVGKMQFYLALLDDTVKAEYENPSIGIIICKEKEKTVVEYALKQSNKPIGVTSYHITKTLPKEYKKALPEPERIASLIELLG